MVFLNARSCGGRGLRRFGGWRRGGHGRVPIEQATATIAGEQLALAELVPHLGPNAHAAAGTLLVVNAGQAGAAGAGKAVVADQRLGLDERSEGIAFNIESGQFGGELLLAECGAGAGFVQGASEGLDQGAGGAKRGFLGISALQAIELFGFQAVGLGGFKGDFVFDGLSLLGGFYGIELDAEARCLLAVGGDLAIEARAQRFLAAERGRGFGGYALGLSEGGLSLHDFGWQCAHGDGEAGSLQIHVLQLYEIFNMRLHLCNEVYGIGHVIRNRG